MYVTVYIITEWFTEWKFNLKKTPIFGDLYGRVDGIQSSYVITVIGFKIRVKRTIFLHSKIYLLDYVVKYYSKHL